MILRKGLDTLEARVFLRRETRGARGVVITHKGSSSRCGPASAIDPPNDVGNTFAPARAVAHLDAVARAAAADTVGAALTEAGEPSVAALEIRGLSGATREDTASEPGHPEEGCNSQSMREVGNGHA